MTRQRLLLGTLGLVLGLTAAPGATGTGLRVISGGALKPALSPLAEEFARDSGNFVKTEFAPMGLLAKRLAAGEVFDVLILTPEALQPLEQRGTVAPGMVTPLGRVGIGVVVNEKAPVPQIGSAEMLRQTLLRARSVIYIDPSIGTSGKYVAQMINRLGITEQMKAKTTLGTGGYVVEPVGRGEIELGIHQISEMLPVRGVRLVGELPPEFQHYTMYVAAIPENAKEKDAAGALIRFLTGSHAKQTFRDAGILPP